MKRAQLGCQHHQDFWKVLSHLAWSLENEGNKALSHSIFNVFFSKLFIALFLIFRKTLYFMVFYYALVIWERLHQNFIKNNFILLRQNHVLCFKPYRNLFFPTKNYLPFPHWKEAQFSIFSPLINKINKKVRFEVR